MSNKDDQELLSVDVTSGVVDSRFISVFHCFSIQNQLFFGVNNPKNDQVCMEVVVIRQVSLSKYSYFHILIM